MTVERMGVDDWERVRAMRLRALAEAPDAFEATLEEEQAKASEFWRTRLASAEAATFVATWQGEDVGLVMGAEYRGRERAAGLFGMWTAPERRGCGVATELVEVVVSWARSAGYARVSLDVADTNAAAIHLYERAGFRSTGVVSTLPVPRTHINLHEREMMLLHSQP